MQKAISFLALAFIIISGLSSYADTIDNSKNWGIGLYGNYPLLGGISVRYNGLSPVYLQAIGRYYLDGKDKKGMLGTKMSYSIHEYVGKVTTRVYFSVGAGAVYEKWQDWKWVYGENTNEEFTNFKKVYGAGITFGIEILLPFFGPQIGFDFEVGQGYGKIKEWNRDRDRISLILGAGGHIYF